MNFKLVQKIIIIFLVSYIQFYCASRRSLYIDNIEKFNSSNTSLLKTGLSGEQVIKIFGKPDQVYYSYFGKNTGNEWKGAVWLYFTEKDPNIIFTTRYKKQQLVFAVINDELLLNHWTLEK